MQRTQPNPDRELLAEIERLEPLAKWEQLASGPDNPWMGKTEELEAGRAALEAARTRREAEAQAEVVRRYQDLLDRREEVLHRLAEFDAKLAAMGETTRDYFRAANNRMRWSGLGLRRDPRTGKEIVEAVSPHNRRDALGNLLDDPPLDCNGRLTVPLEEWEAVKRYRALYFQRSAVAAEQDGIDRNLRGMEAGNPALKTLRAQRQ